MIDDDRLGGGHRAGNDELITEQHASFSALYLERHGDIAKLCASILRDRADAEDATEETFAKVWRATVNNRAEARSYPWLRTVARNHCYDVLRKKKRSRPTDATTLEAIGPALAGSDDTVVADVEAALVRESVRRVAANHRSILALREDSEMSYQEIADHQSVPVSVVESRLYRARQAVRREFLALAGPGGALSVICLRFRGRWLSGQVSSVQLVNTVNDRLGATGITRIGAASSVVATTAVAAIATFGPVQILPKAQPAALPVVTAPATVAPRLETALRPTVHAQLALATTPATASHRRRHRHIPGWLVLLSTSGTGSSVPLSNGASITPPSLAPTTPLDASVSSTDGSAEGSPRNASAATASATTGVAQAPTTTLSSTTTTTPPRYATTTPSSSQWTTTTTTPPTRHSTTTTTTTTTTTPPKSGHDHGSIKAASTPQNSEIASSSSGSPTDSTPQSQSSTHGNGASSAQSVADSSSQNWSTTPAASTPTGTGSSSGANSQSHTASPSTASGSAGSSGGSSSSSSAWGAGSGGTYGSSNSSSNNGSRSGQSNSWSNSDDWYGNSNSH